MKTKITFILLILLTAFLYTPNLLAADCATDPIDYECWCDEEHTILSAVDFPNMPESFISLLNNYENFGKTISLDENTFLLCFNGSNDIITSISPYKIIDTVEVNIGKENQLHIYSLHLQATSETKLNVGSNVTFKNITITGTSTNPLSLSGSDITIEDSEIHFKDIGIALNDAKNVKVTNTKLIGDGTPDSKGIYVNNQSTLISKAPTRRELFTPTLLAEEDTFENSDFGVFVYSGNNVKVDKATFKIEDPTTAIHWANKKDIPVVDMNMVGKKLDESGETISIIAGLPPSCSDKIFLYKLFQYEQNDIEITAVGQCEIRTIDNNDKFCLSKLGETENIEHCLDDAECIFECHQNLETNHNITFITEDNNNSYGFAEPIRISNLGNIASIELISDPGAPSGGTAGVAIEDEDDDEKDSGSEEMSAAGLDSGGDIDATAPLNMDGPGIKPSCSLIR